LTVHDNRTALNIISQSEICKGFFSFFAPKKGKLPLVSSAGRNYIKQGAPPGGAQDCRDDNPEKNKENGKCPKRF